MTSTNKSECKYHHHSLSEWVCSNCEINLCKRCVPFGHSSLWGTSGPRCILCNQALEFLGASSEKAAFWTQLFHFIQYPFHTNSLMVIAFVSFFSFMVPFFGFISIGILIFLASITVKYGFKIIESRAHNISEAPSASSLLEKDENYLFLKLMAIMLCLYGGAIFISGDSESLFEILNWSITFVLPAITIILAIEKSFSHAINPVNVIGFIMRIGWAYLLVWFCYQIVSSGPNFIMPALANIIPDFLVFPFFVMIGLYFWFTANCMLGYIVYQYQDVLGHVTIADEELEVDEAEFDKKRVLAEAYILLRENNIESARNTIRPMLDKFKGDKELHDFYHKLILIEKDVESAKAHADFFIDSLLQQGDEQHAATIFQDTLAKIADYRVTNVEYAYHLAQVLESRGRKKETLVLLTNLHKNDPQHPLIAPAYFMLAKLHSEYKNSDEQAKKILEFILAKYPNAEIKPQVLHYHEVLSNL